MAASQVPQVTIVSADGVTAVGSTGVITVSAVPSNGVLTDRSGTITTGGTAQNAMAANSSRKYLLIRNPTTATAPLWFNFTTAAVVTGSPSIRLDPGDSFIMESGFVSTEAISVIAATTGHAFTAKEG